MRAGHGVIADVRMDGVTPKPWPRSLAQATRVLDNAARQDNLTPERWEIRFGPDVDADVQTAQDAALASMIRRQMVGLSMRESGLRARRLSLRIGWWRLRRMAEDASRG